MRAEGGSREVEVGGWKWEVGRQGALGLISDVYSEKVFYSAFPLPPSPFVSLPSAFDASHPKNPLTLFFRK